MKTLDAYGDDYRNAEVTIPVEVRDILYNNNNSKSTNNNNHLTPISQSRTRLNRMRVEPI